MLARLDEVSLMSRVVPFRRRCETALGVDNTWVCLRAGWVGYRSPMTTVLIAIDESDSSRTAAEAATAIFGPDARYLAINVATDPQLDSYVWGDVYGYPYPPVIPANPEPVDAAEAIASARHTASDLAIEAGVEHATAIGEVGDPVDAIVNAAEHHFVDVIVAGWHERGWVRRLFEDSVSEGLVKASPVPVMVVPLDHRSRSRRTCGPITGRTHPGRTHPDRSRAAPVRSFRRRRRAGARAPPPA